MKLQYLSRLTNCFTIAIISCFFAAPRPALSQCSNSGLPVSLPKAANAFSIWEKTHSTGLLASTKAEILDQFCQASSHLHDDKHIDFSHIDDESESVISEYLNLQSNKETSVESLSALLYAKFGSEGFARPIIKRYGILNITYSHPVDRLEVDGETLDPWPSLLVSLGTANIVGTEQSTEVCSGTVGIQLAVAANFSC